jgi:hypothetical protein
MAAALAGVVALSGLAWAGWEWRHPQAFHEYGGWGVGNRALPRDNALIVGMTYQPLDATGTVSIHAARAKVVVNTAAATFDYYVCTVDTSQGIVAIGSMFESDLDKDCSSVVDVEGATLDLDVDAHQQVVLSVTTHQPGRVVVRGMEVDYSTGWRSGTQLVGGEVRLRTR